MTMFDNGRSAESAASQAAMTEAAEAAVAGKGWLPTLLRAA
jgi:hypothetical protein